MGSDAASQRADATAVQAYIAERDIAWVRFGIIAFNVALYLTALPHDSGRHTLALWVCALALMYAVFVLAVRPHERFPILRTSTYTVLTDSLLIGLWLYATGGLASPFYALWAVSLVAIVFRFSPGIVALATCAYMTADVSMLVISGDATAANAPVIAARMAYVLITGTLGMLLGYRWQAAVRARIEIAREVKDQEMLVAESARVRALTDAAFEGICIHRDGRILEFNQAFAALFGKSRDEITGMDVRDLVHPSSSEVLENRLANPADEGYELWIRRGGEKRLVAVQGRPIEYQGRPARVAAVRDITQRHEAEQHRALAHERQVEIDRLRAIDEFRNRFINTAAHELNTPLTPIKLQFAVMRDQWQGSPRAIQLVERNLDRLSALVRDMLDVARLETGRLRITASAMDARAVLDDVVETFQPTAAQQGVALALDAAATLQAHGDAGRVTQILTNLLSNALKFSRAGGHVSVTARAKAAVCRIEVADDGPGVDPERVERLFQPFGQVHDDAAVPGTGLGLYICKTLAEAMGGRMGYEERRPGSMFWVELPTHADAMLSDATHQAAQGVDMAARDARLS